MDHPARFLAFLAAAALGYALVFGASVALAAETWSASSGSYTSAHASGPREYTYQNVGGVQSYQYDTPGGHSTVTYRPAGSPGVGNHVYDNTGSGATARTGVNVPYAPGKTGKAQIHTPIPAAKIAKAAAALAKAVGPVALAASAVEIYDALTDDGYAAMPDDPDTWAKAEPPTAPNPVTGASGGGTKSTASYSSLAEALAQLCAGVELCSVTARNINWDATTYQAWCTPMVLYSGKTDCYSSVTAPYGSAIIGPRRNAFYPKSGTACPEGMTHMSGPDGCWSNGETRPLTPEEAAAMEDAIVDGCPGGCGFGPMIPPILDAGGVIEGPFGPSWITIPDSGPGGGYTSDSQTTTRPDGTQQVTQNSYAPSASGDTVQVQRTTTVTEKDALGNVISTTTTVGTATPEAPPAEDQPGLCDQFPDVVACWTSGTVPEAETVAEETIDVTLTPTSMPGGAGYCPADIPIVVAGKSFAISWGTVCQFATGVNPIVIALAWISAGFLLFGSVRGRP